MIVLYRMCPEGNPDKQRPVWPKLKLIEACYESFKKAFEGLDVTIHFIIDKPTPELVAMVKDCPFQHDYCILRTQGWQPGNEASYFKQLDMASETTDKVLLLEDDYYFVEGAGRKIIEALEKFDFITPYDHPGYYTELKHNYKRDVEARPTHHWQTVIDTTLTFGARSGTLIRDNIDKFKAYSVWDEKMWTQFTNYELWSPIPSLATHMETPYLAPTIEWQKYF